MTPKEQTPWCCHPDCKRDAELRLRDTSDGIPYDQRETDACVEHAPYLGWGADGVILVGALPLDVRERLMAADLSAFDAVACACGSANHPLEKADAGLYIGEGGAMERICGVCWMTAALAAPSAKALDEARKYGITTDMEPR